MKTWKVIQANKQRTKLTPAVLLKTQYDVNLHFREQRYVFLSICWSSGGRYFHIYGGQYVRIYSSSRGCTKIGIAEMT